MSDLFDPDPSEKALEDPKGPRLLCKTDEKTLYYTPPPWKVVGDKIYSKSGPLEAKFDARVQKHFGHGWTNDAIRLGNARIMAASPQLFEAVNVDDLLEAAKILRSVGDSLEMEGLEDLADRIEEKAHDEAKALDLILDKAPESS